MNNIFKTTFLLSLLTILLAARPATAHMFIVNPLTGGGMMSFFSTHPPMEERIARLESLATRTL